MASFMSGISMIITVDDAIPYWEEAFSDIGEIRPFSGRDLKRNAIEDCDALIVRSITRVDAPLLEGSSVRFVASASAGIDHVNLGHLHEMGIGFGYAPGCNANAVSEYFATALSVFASRKGWNLEGKTLAVIGVGHVGTRVAQKGLALGMKTLLCDPPLREQTGDSKYLDYEELLGADVLTYHVPLVTKGDYPTYHMLNEEILRRLSSGQVVMNASRGAVFDNKILKKTLLEKKIEGAILDVWEGEPQLDYSLLDCIDIGTPHVAGSSLDGKIRATEMVCKALHDFFSIPTPWDGNHLFSGPVDISPDSGCIGRDAVMSILLKAYNILEDDARLRNLKAIDSIPEANAGFDRLRSTYKFRPEFCHFTVVLDEQRLKLAGIFKALGFQVRQGTVT
jgi:erythronate-4-phosphate dehydrogenase